VPELPEVETVRRGLSSRVAGRLVTDVEVGRERTVRRTSRDAVVNGLRGTRFTSFDRRGKYLVGSLDSGDAVMIHLRMSGQLLLVDPGLPRSPHSHVVLTLGPASPGETATEELRFVDPRTFGEVVVFDPERTAIEVPELARLGVDPIADGLDRRALGALLHDRRRQLKPLLLDQHVIAGLGNIYTDEILHRAKLHPLRSADGLGAREIARLHEALHVVLVAAIESGGSTLSDAQYIDLMGSGGAYQDEHLVYAREGEACRTCSRGIILRIPIGGRSTHLCPRCQPRR
jgi:formamidopyrimidine-DNA glycosylase